MPNNDHQERSTRFSKEETTVFAGPANMRGIGRGFITGAMPDGTAEDQLEGYLNTAMMKVMAEDK